MGVPYFGASGTVECAAFLTKFFKSVGKDAVGNYPGDHNLIGFSGLMLATLEDEGMAAGAAADQVDLRVGDVISSMLFILLYFYLIVLTLPTHTYIHTFIHAYFKLLITGKL